MKRSPIRRKSWMKRGTKPLRKVNSARQEKRNVEKRKKVQGRRDAAGKMPLRRNSSRKKVWRRKPSDFARIYGSRARVEWVKFMPCVACGTMNGCDNAHIRNGGRGRKADARFVVPLCSRRVNDLGCHWRLHHMGRTAFEKAYAIALDAEATATDATWRAIQQLHASEPSERVPNDVPNL